MRSVLAVGGSDSGGGAGIQADLKALHAVGVHACTAVTAVTAQDSTGVHGVWPVPVAALRAQLRAVLGDMGADVVKTGMLPTADAVRAVVEEVGDRPLVVDPVGVSSTGQQLSPPEALAAVREVLLPRALVVTPNLAEVAVLTGRPVPGPDDLEDAALAVLALGPRWVLVTGGHLEGDPVDLLHDGRAALRLAGRRVPTAHTHGTGCTLAAALAGYLARGEDVPTAALRAKELVTAALERAYPLGSGPGPVGALPC